MAFLGHTLVGGDHFGYKVLKGVCCKPAQLLAGLGGIPQQRFQLGRTELAWGDAHH